MVTIKGDNLYVTTTNKGLELEIKHESDDNELYNFEIVAGLEKNQLPWTSILIQL